MPNEDDPDIAEARSLLGAFAEHEHLGPSRAEAVKQLLAELTALNGFLDVEVKKHKEQETMLSVSFCNRSGYVSTDGHTFEVGFLQYGQMSKAARVQLLFDAALNKFEGVEPDKYFLPVPGNRPRRRAATAVLIEALVEVWKAVAAEQRRKHDPDDGHG